MKIKPKKIFDALKLYLIAVLLFVSVVYIFNTIETILFCKSQTEITVATILLSYFNISAVCCLYALILLPIYLLLSLLNRKTAQILVSVVFALLMATEIGLYIYSMQAGVLMGRELIVRPIVETMITIRNSSNIFIDFISIICVITFFIVMPPLMKKVKIFNHILFVIITTLIIGLFSTLTLCYQRDENPAINNYIESKTYHFFAALRGFIDEEQEIDYSIKDEKRVFEKNEQLLKEYIALYNNKSQANMDYPMERPASEFSDVLAPFFRKSEKQPHIVIIIVESLGNYLLGDKGNHITFTPFLDSLASVGLYWKNCVSTTSRTYGVLPSVMGSVPHGMRGFQFGIMPKHHSLFSILKNNDYTTNFFYGGDLSFDCMLDFVSVQEPDHIDNFLPELKSYKKKKQACWWGLYDHILFNKSIDHIKTQSREKPKANLYLTLTTHDPLGKENVKLKEHYETKADELFSKFDEKQKKYFLPAKDRISGFLYIDDCIRDFIHDYSKQIDAENTIFIITGDHSVDIFKNNLAYYSVPLIIWSPLIQTPENFPNIVSHLSIPPSIISFLQHNYNLKVSNKLAWCSLGLDTSPVFNPAEKTLFLSYDRKVNAMIYNQYYFEDKTEWHDRRLYEINENFDLQEIKDDCVLENIYSKFLTLKYVNNYVYHNDKLVKTVGSTEKGYKLINTCKNDSTVVCKTPDTIPSIAGVEQFEMMSVQKIKGQYNKIKIKMSANIIINDFVYQDQQMMLNIICKGKDFNYEFKDHITKYIEDEELLCGKQYPLIIEKEIDVRHVENISVHIFVSTNSYDQAWKRDKKITLSNIKMLIYGK